MHANQIQLNINAHFYNTLNLPPNRIATILILAIRKIKYSEFELFDTYNLYRFNKTHILQILYDSTDYYLQLVPLPEEGNTYD